MIKIVNDMTNKGQFVQGYKMNVYILKILVYLQILFDVNLNVIEKFDFLKIFCYFGGINLSEKSVNVSCCIVLVSNMSKILAFY